MKKATKVKEQIEEIKKRGLNIDCSDDLIESYFSIVGYYSLGFYLFPFEKSYPSIVNRTHKYKENARFSDVILLYKANTELRFIILEYLSFFENFFKTLLIYKVSNKYHNNPTWFVDNTILKIDIGNFNKIYNGLKNSHKPIYNHHMLLLGKLWNILLLAKINIYINLYSVRNLKKKLLKNLMYMI